MNYKAKEITKYFRSAVAAQASMGIDFKADSFSTISPHEVIQGRINQEECKNIFAKAHSNSFNDENIENQDVVNIIICAKTIKINFEANEKIQDDIPELTGMYYIPAIINIEGELLFDNGEKKLPWIPRECLMPMVEPQLAIGYASVVDNFMSDNVDKVKAIKSWTDYVNYFKNLYEVVAESAFEENTIRNIDPNQCSFELEQNMYVFVDKTIHSTFHIMRLYNHLLDDNQSKALYNNFISTQIATTSSLIENSLDKMKMHCGQMNGEYPMSPSQREAINHFNAIETDEILAINGPPGTGKTTLLQTIVADMYVKRAIQGKKPPLIVASSTNNQAVTNIIASFGNISKMGISNLEERWIEGVNSFASYFPSLSKVKEAKNKKYQYTNQKGEFFVSAIEAKDNLGKSKDKLIKHCDEYFGTKHKDITACQKKLHDELLYIEKSKIALLSLADEASQ